MCTVSLQERLPFERKIWLFRGEFKWYGSLPEPLTRPQSSLLRKERSARGDGKEERGTEKPFPPWLCLFRRLDRRVGKKILSFCMNKPATSLAISQGY